MDHVRVRFPISGRTAAADPERRAAQVFAAARALVDPAYRAAVCALPKEICHVAGYHIGWWAADGRHGSDMGKALRPALAMACARAVNAERVAITADVGVAVELAHDFSLLHDDVIDGDLVRRHRPAAWAVFGTSQAILVGDALLTRAMQQLCARNDSINWVKVLAHAVQEMCRGQAEDLAFERRTDVTVAECLAMAEGKTGALIGAACQLGALAAGAGDDTALHYRTFGRHLGVAFQLIDDLLGIWGDPKTTGKPVGSDLAARKKTLPIVAALTSGTPAGEWLSDLYSGGELDQQAIDHAVALVEAAGGRAWARTQATRQLDRALQVLDSVDPRPEGAADLKALAAVLSRRDH